MTFLARLVATIVGGALYSLPFVEPKLAPFAFIGVAPALVVLCSPRKPIGNAAIASWALLGAAVLVYLFALPVKAVSPVAMAIQGGFILLPWAWAGLACGVWLRRRTGWPLAVIWPSCWLVAEWGWSFHSVGSLAFGLSGYTQFVYPRLIQVADVVGALGVGAVIQVVVGALADLGLAWLDRPGLDAVRRAKGSLAAAAALVLATLGYGTWRLAPAEVRKGPSLAVIQPAMPHDFNDAQIRLVQLKQLTLARSRVKPGEVDMVLFPENAVLKPIEGTPYLREFQDLSEQLRTPLLVGVTTRTKENIERMRRGLPEREISVGTRRFWVGHNSSALIGPEGILEKYDKVHLLPFSERPPAEQLFASLGLLDTYHHGILAVLGYLGVAAQADEVKLLDVPGHRSPPYWAPLCFEIADSRLARRAWAKGARYFINLTSEGDLGPQIYWNTVGISTLRAVELRVGVVRCGNQGISCAIDPWGRMTHVLRGARGGLWQEPGVLKLRAPIGPDSPTIYARLGDWPVGAAGGLLGAAFLVAYRRRRSGLG